MLLPIWVSWLIRTYDNLYRHNCKIVCKVVIFQFFFFISTHKFLSQENAQCIHYVFPVVCRESYRSALVKSIIDCYYDYYRLFVIIIIVSISDGSTSIDYHDCKYISNRYMQSHVEKYCRLIRYLNTFFHWNSHELINLTKQYLQIIRTECPKSRNLKFTETHFYVI